MRLLQLLMPAILTVCTVYADDPPAPIQFAAAIQANYTGTPLESAKRTDPGLGYLQDLGQLRLTEATLTITGDWKAAGFRVDGGTGDFYSLAMAGDSWQGPNRYISQAYLYWKPIADGPIRLEAGKFFSSVGAESPQSYLDFNTTRSLLFWYGEPLYHAGARATVAVTPAFTVGAQILSGCNTIAGMRGHQTMAFTAAGTGKRWGWSEIYMGGNEKTTGRGWRQLSDSVLTLNPWKKATAYVEALAAVERRVSGGYDSWYGAATAWKLSPWARWNLSPRVEWYNDRDGATTGTAQRLTAFTLTGEFRPAKFAIARLEYRRQWSDAAALLVSGDSFLYRGQTLTAGITLLVHRGL